MIEYTDDDQRTFVEQIVFVAVQMTKPLPADLTHRDGIPGRLNIVVSGILSEMEGNGGIDQVRLSPKGQPHIDLVDAGLRGQWLRRIENDGSPAYGFLAALLGVYANAQRQTDLAQALGLLLTGLAELIERDYELAAQYTNDDGKWIGEGADIAPGLAAATRSAWADREAIAA